MFGGRPKGVDNADARAGLEGRDEIAGQAKRKLPQLVGGHRQFGTERIAFSSAVISAILPTGMSGGKFSGA